MKVMMVMVASADGKITNGENPNVYTWTSKEDQDHFFSLIAAHNLIVMGSKTYEHAKPVMKLKEGIQRVVLTSRPESYQSDEVEGQLHFERSSPEDLVKRYEHAGYSKLLLVGGAETNYRFLKAALVDELYLTLEPIMFGKGGSIIEGEIEASLTLLEVKKLNEKGTLLLHYRIT